MKKLIITGCEGRGDADQPYLTRWTLFRTNMFALYLHKFHRSDADDLHDHPWSFLSVIIWRGYNEVTFDKNPTLIPNSRRITKRIYPGMIIYRPATHTHRVVLSNGKPAYTLVLRFKYKRYWGFWVKGKWQLFSDYFKEIVLNYENTRTKTAR